jgi:hypothetical protein
MFLSFFPNTLAKIVAQETGRIFQFLLNQPFILAKLMSSHSENISPDLGTLRPEILAQYHSSKRTLRRIRSKNS